MAKTAPDPTRTLTFQKSVYKPAAIRKAVKDYSRAAAFHVTETPNAVSVRVSQAPGGMLDELCDEFCNYALVMMKG